MRLEMRNVAGLAVAVLGPLLSAGCCCKRPFLVGDAVSGGPDGYAFVKVTVILHKTGTAAGCGVLRVLPDRVHVFPGSAIRWSVTNDCGVRRHLKFTPPTPIRAGAEEKALTAAPSTAARERPPVPGEWFFANCTPEIDLGPQADAKNVLLCEVPDKGVRDGVYKYNLEGDIDTYDPEIEVHGGGGK